MMVCLNRLLCSSLRRYAVLVVVGVILLAGFTVSAQAKSHANVIRVQSVSQTYQPFEGLSRFEGDVKVAMNQAVVTGSTADFQMDEEGKPKQAVFTEKAKMVRKDSGMKQTVHADVLTMELKNNSFEAKGHVSTQINDNAGDISIQSDTQIFDQEKNIMRAIGHVTVRKGDMLATSPEAIIFMGGSGRAEKAVFIKGARLIQRQQEMKGEMITIHLESGNIYAEKNTESIMDGKDDTGNPTKINVKSHLQEYVNDTGTLIANGNAVIHYDDYLAKGPKAVFYQVEDKLDHIILSGRAEIEDNERRVTGDVVTITISPKQFNAKGNVTTYIKAKQQPVQPAASGGGKTSAMSLTTVKKSHPPSQALEDEMMIDTVTREGSQKP